MTDSTIRIGIAYNDADSGQRDAAFAAIGIDSSQVPNQGDSKKQSDAVISHINRNGGMAGRKVEPVYYHNRSGSTTETMCVFWNEDNEVFVMAPSVNQSDPTMVACAARHKTPFVAVQSQPMVSREAFAEFAPYYYAPHYLLADRRDQMLVDSLGDDGFFGAQARIGLLIQDHPWVRQSVTNTLKPAIEAAGGTIAAEATYTGIESPWANMVLRFQERGVTHVVWSATNVTGLAAIFFMRAAEDQRYRPLYGLSSDQCTFAIQALGGASIEAQMRNVRGAGWWPFCDVGYAGDSEIDSPNDRLCRELMKAANEPPGGTSSFRCEALFFLKAALDRATEVSVSGFAAAVESLDTAYRATSTLGGATRFGPGRHDGAGIVRDLAYEDRCSCFVYRGDRRPIEPQ